MTQERLQELIDKRGAVWTSICGGYWFKLNPKQYKIVVTDKHPYYNDGTILLCYKKFEEPSGYDIDYELTDLREDIDRALWERDMTTEQVVKFTPPMWEDIEEHFDCIDYKFAFVKNNEVYSFTVGKNGAIDISKWFIYSLGFHPIYTADSTKENYEKACEIVKDLFRGETK